MHVTQDVSPRSHILDRLVAPIRRLAGALGRRSPPRAGPYVQVLASVPSRGPGALLTMRGPDGIPFRCVEIGRSPAWPGPGRPGAVEREPERRSA